MRALVLTACFALGTAGFLAASASEGRAQPATRGWDPDRPLVVTRVTPAPNQATLPDLSDPGLNNVVTVRFSTYPRPGDLVDERDTMGVLSSKCSFRNQAFAMVPVTASVRQNMLTLDPFTYKHPTLPLGRFTLTLRSSIRSRGGRLLNDGRGTFTYSFTVGRHGYSPILLRVSPRDGATGVGLHRAVIATFDQPIDPLSSFESVRLEDRSTEPPTPIHSLVTLERRGFDVVVHAESPGFAPGADIALVIQGRGTGIDPSRTVLKQRFGHEFGLDGGPRWWSLSYLPTLFHSDVGDYDAVTGEFSATFRTRTAAAGSRR